MIILLASEKGGVGKSTISTNLAAGYAAGKQDVILIDADPQGTSSRWSLLRKEGDYPQIDVKQAKGRVGQIIAAASKKYDIVIVDTPGRNSDEMNSALEQADVAIFPMRPSQPDIDTLETLSVNLAKALEKNPKLRSRILLSAVPTHYQNQETINETVKIIQAFKGMKVAKTIIYERKAYRDAIADGKGVVELVGAKKAREEIFRLAMELAAW